MSVGPPYRYDAEQDRRDQAILAAYQRDLDAEYERRVRTLSLLMGMAGPDPGVPANA